MATGRVPTTANSPLTTKGDLFGYSTAPARLAVGNDGEQIVADSSTSTGLRYQAPVNANPVINSNFSVWQRGTSIVGTSLIPYTADRWQIGRGGSVGGTTVTRQATGDTTNLPFIQYCARVQRDSGNTSTAVPYFMQSFESVNSIPYAGKTVTFSFYARAGANFSAASSILSGRIDTGTGTDQNVFTGYTGSATPINQAFTLTTTWQRFTVTASFASTITELGILFNYTPVGTAGANDYFEVTGVQLEVGSVATPYKPTGATFQGELAACQRYYAKSYNQGTNPATATSTGSVGMAAVATGANANIIPCRFPVEMRTTPTVTIYSPGTGTSGKIQNVSAASDVNATDLGTGSAGFGIYVTGAPGGAVGYWLAGQFTASAEL